MSLTPGTRLGVYQITAPIGEGGMGQVYRARDTKLDRDVAIKILPDAFAHDADRLARFQREAKTLASLNHPNIAAIYGLEESAGMTALVMELVDGEDLSQRIARGAIPIDEALPIARQICEALEAAHEQGIIHRDLKPANIKVRPDGAVKVLDFGLAKALDSGPTTIDASRSPTITSPAMVTGVGVLLGTAAYMSPEQARGKVVDKRTDIWAFGCVVYEMLTGHRAFEGDEISDVLARIIEREPDFTALPPATPASVQRLLLRCLIKDPRKRLPDVGAARLDIDEALAGSAPAVVPVLPARSFPRRAAVVVLVGGLTIGAAIGAVGVWVARAPVAAGMAAFTVETPGAAARDGFALSPDGRQLVFTALDNDGRKKLWLRPLDSTTARALPGTEQADIPFWSPDSRMVAFFTADELKRIDLAGGAVHTIAKTSSANAAGGTWNDQNVILFSRGGSDSILRVAAGGGEPETITKPDTAANGTGIWPTFLPDGRHFLYLKIVGPSIAENSQLIWRALDSADERVVRKMYSKAFYSPTGHLLFSLGGPVVAQQFNASSGTVSGDPVQLVGDTVTEGSGTSLAISPAGVLAHRAGNVSAAAQLWWIGRDGKKLAPVGAAADYRNAVIDRAGERVVANTFYPSDVWLIDSRRGTTSRITFDVADDSDPIFSPDGRWIVFYSARQPAGIYRKASNGAAAEELVAATGPNTYPSDWSPDGRFVLYTGDKGKTTGLWVLPMTGDRKQSPYLATTATDTDGQFSPDGRWIAYTSYETGRAEVFVQDFPSTGAKFQVSVAGGIVPRWGRNGRELYFLAPADGRLMSVDVESTPEFRLGVPRPLFQTGLMNLRAIQSRRYGVGPDGTRFMMNVPVGEDALAPITVLLNWQALLNK